MYKSINVIQAQIGLLRKQAPALMWLHASALCYLVESQKKQQQEAGKAFREKEDIYRYNWLS